MSDTDCKCGIKPNNNEHEIIGGTEATVGFYKYLQSV